MTWRSKMADMMKVAIWHGPEDVRIEERPIPEIDDNSVLIKTRVSLTCGTDVKTFHRGHPSVKPGGTFGHEVAGDIVKAGKNVKNFKVGDRVVPHNTGVCGKCFYCKSGRPDGSCEDKARIVGGHSEYVVVPGRIVELNMFHIPEGVPYKAAALTEPFSCAVYGADMTKTSYNDTVVILGAGPIGLMIAMLMKMKGARVIHADFSAPRLEVSKSLGTDMTFDLTGVDDPVKALRELTPGKRGADATIDATGQPAAWEQCIDIVRKGGYVNLFGGCKPGTKISVDTQRMHYDGLTLAGFFHTTPWHVKMANDLINAGKIPVDTFVTGEFPFARLEDAIRAHSSQKGIKSAIIYE